MPGRRQGLSTDADQQRASRGAYYADHEHSQENTHGRESYPAVEVATGSFSLGKDDSALVRDTVLQLYRIATVA